MAHERPPRRVVRPLGLALLIGLAAADAAGSAPTAQRPTWGSSTA